MPFAKFTFLFVSLAAAGVALYSRHDAGASIQSTPLAELPERLDARISTDVSIDEGTLALLGDGRFLNRVYQPAQSQGPDPNSKAIGLFIAYFPTQRSGQAIHSPQNCLPGAGWSFVSSQTTTVPNMPGAIGEYVITNGTSKQLVLYWYRAHGRTIANDYAAKGYMMWDAIRSGRTDGALIRVITPISTTEPYATAHDRAVGFVAELAPLLPRFLPN